RSAVAAPAPKDAPVRWPARARRDRQTPDPAAPPPDRTADAAGSRMLNRPRHPARHIRPRRLPLFLGPPVLMVRQLFADPRGLARTVAQVIELRAPDIAAPLHFDRGNRRRVELESPLDALAAGDLAHHERAVEPAVALADHHAFVGLHALARTFDDIDIH